MTTAVEQKFNLGDYVQVVRRVPQWQHWSIQLDACVNNGRIYKILQVLLLADRTFAFLLGTEGDHTNHHSLYFPSAALSLALSKCPYCYHTVTPEHTLYNRFQCPKCFRIIEE